MDIRSCDLQPLREDGEFVLYRARPRGGQMSMLALVARQSTAKSVARLEHEFGLASVLGPDWAARPLEFSRHPDPATLILEDNASDPLVNGHHQPLDLLHTPTVVHKLGGEPV